MTKKVAIACQGGGTHAAFTWGVLTRILETKQRWDAEGDGGTRFDITAISGTSAGALCALAAWYGLVANTGDPGCGSIEKAIERLDFLWTSFAARTPAEQTFDGLVGATLRLKESGVPLPAADPYSVSTDLTLRGLSLLGAREEFLSFAPLLESLCPHFDHIHWREVADTGPRMLAGAVEIQSGNFEVFDSHKTLEQMELRPRSEDDEQYEATRWRMRRPLTLAGVAASGTLPEVLPAQRIEDTMFPTCTPDTTVRRDAFYWDGLYSQNPPVRQLLDDVSVKEKPDEIWVVRINPQELNRRFTSLEEIRDRTNDLSGNTSLNAELDHILSVNRWIAEYGNEHPCLATRKPVVLRTIKMKPATAWGLHASTKFDRSMPHLEALRREGLEVAEQWLDGWRTHGDAFDSYPNDARYVERDVAAPRREASS
jgi:NTE family protein